MRVYLQEFYANSNLAVKFGQTDMIVPLSQLDVLTSDAEGLPYLSQITIPIPPFWEAEIEGQFEVPVSVNLVGSESQSETVRSTSPCTVDTGGVANSVPHCRSCYHPSHSLCCVRY